MSVNSKKKVLIVDDEKDIVNFLEKFLSRFDISAIKTTPGEEVVDCCKRDHPDCVFLDIQMPQKDGITILKELKDCQPFPKVIMITGRDEKEFHDKAKRHGAIDYITKPLDLSDLSKKIEEHILNEG